MKEFKRGDVLIPETGECDGFDYHGPFRVLRDFSNLEVVRAYLADRPKQGLQYSFKEDEFLSWLETEGYVELLPVVKWHFAAYSTLYDREIEGMTDLLQAREDGEQGRKGRWAGGE